MVLPFEPMTMTFKDLHYFVPISKVGRVLSLQHLNPEIPVQHCPNHNLFHCVKLSLVGA